MKILSDREWMDPRARPSPETVRAWLEDPVTQCLVNACLRMQPDRDLAEKPAYANGFIRCRDAIVSLLSNADVPGMLPAPVAGSSELPPADYAASENGEE